VGAIGEKHLQKLAELLDGTQAGLALFDGDASARDQVERANGRWHRVMAFGKNRQ
jgi:hypothetical protein